MIRAWSLNGPFTDDFAKILFEEGSLSGHKWSLARGEATPDDYLDEVIGLPLSRWPRAVWCLVLEHA